MRDRPSTFPGFGRRRRLATATHYSAALTRVRTLRVHLDAHICRVDALSQGGGAATHGRTLTYRSRLSAAVHQRAARCPTGDALCTRLTGASVRRIHWRVDQMAAMLSDVMDPDKLLVAYDDQLRSDAETSGAIVVTRLGPLRLVTFAGGRGFVTYRDLGGADADTISMLVTQTVAHYSEDRQINRVEWKARGHDWAPGLHEALVKNGFEPDDPESIMIGEARALDIEVPLPRGVGLRRVSEENDVRAMSAMQDEVFGNPVSDHMAEELLRRLDLNDGMELWVAETERQIVSAGRLQPVVGTDFAGIWGGATREAWRRQGIYRALTAARARSALAMGKTLIHSDSTEYSRPILERSGLVKVSTTTPYQWRR